MMTALLAAFHYLALGLGLGSVFMRGRYFTALSKASAVERKEILRSLFMADNVWGAAAFLWVSTGLARAFGGFEKGTAFYLGNSLFWVKIGLVLLLFALETPPMITLIRWRIAVAKGLVPTRLEERGFLKTLSTINAVEIGLVFVIPLVASCMARGIFYRF